MEKNHFKGGFRELEIWKEARIFRNEISKMTKKFPDSEKYKVS